MRSRRKGAAATVRAAKTHPTLRLLFPRIAANPTSPGTFTRTNAGSPGRVRTSAVGCGHEEWQSRRMPEDSSGRGGEG